MLHEIMHFVASIPMDDPIPDPGPEAPPGAAKPAGLLIGAFKWGGLVVCVLAIVGAAATFVIQSRRGEALEHFYRIISICVGAFIIGGAGQIIGWINS